MKKVLHFLAIAAMLCFVSCNKDDNKKPKIPGEDDGPTYQAAITIDGQFDDWARLGSKATSCQLQTGAAKIDLNVAKAYLDPLYLYVYMETSPITPDPAAEPGLHWALYFDSDNNAATGGYADQWAPDGVGRMDFFVTGGYWYPDGGWLDDLLADDDGLCKWTGEPGGSGWNWTGVELDPGFVKGKLAYEETANEGEYICTMEFALLRSKAATGKLPDEFGIGFMVQTNSWNADGVLPIAEGGVAANPMVVKVSE